jgi:hypothetical protein
LLALVALFTAAISIDRIGAEHGTAGIASATYALAALAVAAPLAFASLRRTRPWIAATVAFGAYGTLLLAAPPFRNRSVHVIATEVVFLVLAVRLGHHLARTLARFDDTLGVIVFGDTRARDIESSEAADLIHDEIARSRRHGRPLSLTVLCPVPASVHTAVDNAAVEVDRAVRRRYVYGKLARAVGALLVKRVSEAAAIAGIPADTGSASFPGDAIAFESLVEAAEADLAAHLEPAPHLRAVAREQSR